MAFDNLPKYTDAQLEIIASQFLAGQYSSVVRIPVDIEWLITKIPGVTLDCYPGLRDNYFVEGCVLRNTNSGDLFIYIDEKMMDDDSAKGVTRYRTTVAEELAHILIHRQLIEQVDSPDKFRELHNKLMEAKVERNAKRLAAALLMPKEQLWAEAEKEYNNWVTWQGTDEPERLTLMMLGSLSQKFKVSYQAMEIRMKELKVFDAVKDAANRGRPRLL